MTKTIINDKLVTKTIHNIFLAFFNIKSYYSSFSLLLLLIIAFLTGNVNENSEDEEEAANRLVEKVFLLLSTNIVFICFYEFIQFS